MWKGCVIKIVADFVGKQANNFGNTEQRPFETYHVFEVDVASFI